MKKQYIVRKIILAEDIRQVLLLEKKCPVHEVIIDGDWVGRQEESIGFKSNEKNAPQKKTVSTKAKA